MPRKSNRSARRFHKAAMRDWAWHLERRIAEEAAKTEAGTVSFFTRPPPASGEAAEEEDNFAWIEEDAPDF